MYVLWADGYYGWDPLRIVLACNNCRTALLRNNREPTERDTIVLMGRAKGNLFITEWPELDATKSVYVLQVVERGHNPSSDIMCLWLSNSLEDLMEQVREMLLVEMPDAQPVTAEGMEEGRSQRQKKLYNLREFGHCMYYTAQTEKRVVLASFDNKRNCS